MLTALTDVLVIGGGGAGCRAAVEAGDHGASVMMALKGKLGASGATTYEGSEAAGYNLPNSDPRAEDSPEIFYNDIMSAALGMADPDAARVLVEDAEPRMRDLEKWGVHFERESGGYLTIHACFASRKRCHIIKDHGIPIVRALRKQISLRGIQVMEDCPIVSLLVKDGRVTGVLGVTQRNELIQISAKAVVMATGGAGQLFVNSHNPADISAEGYSLAHRAGARLCNLEFMQAGVGFLYPVKVGFFSYLWNGLPDLYNGGGEKFMHRILPPGVTEEAVMLEHAGHFPFSTRDISKYIEIAIQKEIADGQGTQRDTVYLDFRKYMPEYVAQVAKTREMGLWPITRQYFRQRGVDLVHDPVEMTCFAQAMNGGIKIDSRAASNVRGLFAAGEIAGGPHGADRLGGNMIMGSQVFGKLAGENAALYSQGKSNVLLSGQELKREYGSVFDSLYKRIDVGGMDQQLRKAASRNLLIRRTEAGLLDMLETIAGLRKALEAAPGGGRINVAAALWGNKLESAKLISMAALERKESRGSHCRMDYPQRDDALYGRMLLR